jgi:hypothetical protein
MLRNATLLWDLVDKLPSKKSYCILTDDDHQSMALILKQMIASRRSGPSLDFDNTSSTLTAITLMCGDLAVTYRSTCNGKKCLSEAMTFVFTAAFTSP